MTQEEKIEFRNLKYARAEQGFFTPEQQERWDYLHKLHSQGLSKMIAIMREKRLMMLN